MATGKNNAQDFVEMVDTLEKSKAEGLSHKRGQSLYKVQSDEHKKGELQKLISNNINELIETATKQKINLNDTEEVKKRTFIYLKACEQTGTFPSQMGLAKSLGFTDRALRYWRADKSSHATAQWLEMFSDTCSDILTQSALNNNCNSITAIFTNKALYGLRETSEIILSPKPKEDENDYNADEIRARYLTNND